VLPHKSDKNQNLLVGTVEIGLPGLANWMV
jgi:hypothetical protein